MSTAVERLEAFVAEQGDEHIHITNRQAEAFYDLRDKDVDEWWQVFKAASLVVARCVVCSAYVGDASPTRYAQGNVAGRHHVPQPEY